MSLNRIHVSLVMLLMVGMQQLSAFEIASSTRIVLPPTALPVEQTAAGQLQSYLEKISSLRLEIVQEVPVEGSCILIGNSLFARCFPETKGMSWRADEVWYRTAGARMLVIGGAAPRGVLYSVYALLENEFGVRFLGPDCEVVPHREALSFKTLNYRYAPPFEFRNIYSEHTIGRNFDYRAKLRLNGALYGTALPESHGGYYQCSMHHSLGNTLLPRKTWFKSHPEYFAYRKERKGRRDTQLCLSNEQVQEELVREVRALLKREPNRRVVSLGNSDNDQICECDSCLELYRRHESRGAGVWLAANHVAQAIRHEYPQVTVMVQAYWSTERPPKHLSAEPNVSVAFCLLDRNHGLPPVSTARFLPYLEQFRRLTHGQVFIWDYYANFSNFLIPFPNIGVIPAAFRGYGDYGVKGVTVQMPFGNLADFLDFRVYLASRLLWNPQADAEQLRTEFFRHYYGAASCQIEAYWGLLKTARNRQPFWLSCYSEDTTPWLRATDIMKASEVLRKALEAVEGDAMRLSRVEKVQAGLLAAGILRYREMVECARGLGQSYPSRTTLIDRLERLGKKHRCTTYKEWDSFVNFIRRLRKKDCSREVPRRKSKADVIPGSLLQGKGVFSMPGRMSLYPRQQETVFSWMCPDEGEIAQVITAEQSGIREVFMTLRAVTRELKVADGAYVGIYAPGEVCRYELPAIGGDESYRRICLGTFSLPAGSRIWVMPGVTGLVERIDVQSIELH